MNDNSTRAVSDLLWRGGKPGSRGPKPSRTIDEVVAKAIAIADQEGVASVSMQRVAEQLGFTKMALYRYVGNQAGLFALMIDGALGNPYSLPAFSAGWRPRLEEWATAIFEVFSRHPWVPSAMTGARVVGPNEAAWMERGLEALEPTGLDGADKLDALGAVSAHVRFVVQQSAAVPGGASPESGAFRELEHALSLAEFPALAQAIEHTVRENRSDMGLGFGLECLLDGLDARLKRGSSGRARSDEL